MASPNLEEAFRAHLLWSEPNEGPIFSCKDVVGSQTQLIKAIFSICLKPKRTDLETALAGSMQFRFKWTPTKAWLKQECMCLRSHLSKLTRTRRNLKTGERLPSPVREVLATIKKDDRAIGKFAKGTRQLRRKRSGASSQRSERKLKKNTSGTGSDCQVIVPSPATSSQFPLGDESASDIWAAYGLSTSHQCDVSSSSSDEVYAIVKVEEKKEDDIPTDAKCYYDPIGW